MRPWRDIISLATFDKLISKHPRDENPVRMSIAALRQRMGIYHALEKTEYRNIRLRIQALIQVSLAAGEYRAVAAVENPAERSKRGGTSWLNRDGNETGVDKYQKSPETRTFMAGTPLSQSLDRNILTIENRSLRKANYLRMLADFYSEDGRIDNAKFLEEITTDQYRAPGMIGIVKGVRLEAIDPMHRPFELHFGNRNELIEDLRADPFGMNHAFAEWMKKALAQRNTPPFFLWLETSPVCLDEDKANIAAVSSVEYLSAAHAPKNPDVRMVLAEAGRINMTNLVQGNLEPCSTAGYIAAAKKGGAGFAAFAWTENKELFIGRHEESAFHHSSFAGGGAVRCAGMIRIENHRVLSVSNNSGHYKPGKEHLKNFIEWLRTKRVVPWDARVLCLTGQPVDFEGSVADFLATYLRIGLPVRSLGALHLGGHRRKPVMGTRGNPPG